MRTFLAWIALCLLGTGLGCGIAGAYAVAQFAVGIAVLLSISLLII